MAQASTVEIFNCTPEQFYTLISDYEKYPEFLPEVRACRILESSGNKKLVEYEISVVKTFTYSLWMQEEAPTKISWEFAQGDLFKTSHGVWQLENEANKTRATYTVEATFKTFVPGPMAKALISVNLPNMMSAYQKRVSEIFGKP
jgi:coenzyme Q-binding protein COQ10